MNKVRGTLTKWKADKGFGFIRPDSAGEDVFVHIQDFGTLGRPPRVGDIIWYQPVQNGKGKYRAADVSVEGLPRLATRTPIQKKRKSAVHKSSNGHIKLIPAVIYAVAIILLTLQGKLDITIPFICIVMSFCTFMLYAFDKSAAMNNRWRTPENILHLFSLLGGWPGALLAQIMFHHKSKKREFLVLFWITVVINTVLVIGLATEQGQGVVEQLLDRFRF